jgi:uncharacterized RDD family membrane protein YckC
MTAVEVSRRQKPPPVHRDPAVPAAERHVMWLDRQEMYLAWAGLASAFTIALAFLGVSAWLIHSGDAISGTILGTVDIVGLVTVFITRQKRQPTETGRSEPS